MYHIEKFDHRAGMWVHVKSFTSGEVAKAVFESDYDLPSHRLIYTIAETYA